MGDKGDCPAISAGRPDGSGLTAALDAAPPPARACTETRPGTRPRPRRTAGGCSASAHPRERATTCGSAPAIVRSRSHVLAARRAVAAQADDREVAEARAEAGRLAHGLAHAVELLRRHRALGAAALAHEVLALAPRAHVAARRRGRGARAAEAEPLERLEVAVDRGEIGGRQLAEALGDLLGAERRVGRVERLEHRRAAHPRRAGRGRATRRPPRAASRPRCADP